MAGLERIPLTRRYVPNVFGTLTGTTQTVWRRFRWGIFLFSPEEEGQTAAKLASQGWYQAVTEIEPRMERCQLQSPLGIGNTSGCKVISDVQNLAFLPT